MQPEPKMRLGDFCHLKRQHRRRRHKNLQQANHRGMQCRPTVGKCRTKELDALPSLTGPTPTTGHVFDGNGPTRSTGHPGGLAGQPWEKERGDDEPMEPAHGETLDLWGLTWRKMQPWGQCLNGTRARDGKSFACQVIRKLLASLPAVAYVAKLRQTRTRALPSGNTTTSARSRIWPFPVCLPAAPVVSFS